MVYEYESGSALYEENLDFLNTNPYLSVFFRLDCPLLKSTDKTNYALKCEREGTKLLAIKVEPYNMIFFGDKECVPELLPFILDGGYELKSFLCGSEVGEAVTNWLKISYGIEYEESLAMDFMEASVVTEPSSPEVESAVEEDTDEICSLLERFVSDCGLQDKIDRERTRSTINSFRILREDGRIVSMASLSPSTDKDMKIVAVYTRDECRGKGYARKVVNTLKNEILSSGRLATLNVDKKNPVSNRLYASLGFKRVFSQGEYRRK